MRSIKYLDQLPKIHLAQSLRQLSCLNLRQKLEQLRNILSQKRYQRQTQTQSLYWIELKNYKFYTIAILKNGRYEGMFKFKNQKSKQQDINQQQVQMFRKVIQNIIKKQECRTNKVMSIWLIKDVEESFQKEIRYSSDIKPFMKMYKIQESPSQLIFLLLVLHQLVNYAKKSNSKTQKDFKYYLKIYYEMQKQYLKPMYRMLFPKYQENQRHQYILELQYLFKLTIIFLYAEEKEKIIQIFKQKQNINETVLLININPKVQLTSKIQTNQKQNYYEIMPQKLFIQGIKFYFMKFIKDAETRTSAKIIDDLKNKKLKLNQKIIKLKVLMKLNSNNKQLTYLLEKAVTDVQKNDNMIQVEKLQIALQSNQEVNIWEEIQRLCNNKQQNKQKIKFYYGKIDLKEEKQIYKEKLQKLGKQINKLILSKFVDIYVRLWNKFKKIKLNKFILNNKKINLRIPDLSKDIVIKIIQNEYNCKIIDYTQKQISLQRYNMDNDQIKLSLSFKQDANLNKQVVVNKSNLKQKIIDLLIYVCQNQQSSQEARSQLDQENEYPQIKQEIVLNRKQQKLQIWNRIISLTSKSEFRQNKRYQFQKQILCKPHQDQKYLNKIAETIYEFKKMDRIQPEFKKLKNILLKQIEQFIIVKQQQQRVIKRVNQILQNEKAKIQILIDQSRLIDTTQSYQFHMELSENIPPIQIKKHSIKEPLLYFVFDWNNQQKILEYSVWNFNYYRLGQIKKLKISNDNNLKKQILTIARDNYYKYICDYQFINQFKNHLLQKGCLYRFNGGDYQNILTQQQSREQQILNLLNNKKLQSVKHKLRIYSYDQRLYSLLKRVDKYKMLEVNYQNPLMILQFDKSIQLLKIKNYKQQVVQTQYCPNFGFRKIKQKILKMILEKYQIIKKSMRSEQQVLEYNKKRIQIDRINYLKTPQGRKEQQQWLKLEKEQKQLEYKIREAEQQKIRKFYQELEKKRMQQERNKRCKIIKILNLFDQLRISVSDNSFKKYLNQITKGFSCQINYDQTSSLLYIKQINKKYIAYNSENIQRGELIDLVNLLQIYFEQLLRSLYQRMVKKELHIAMDQRKLERIIVQIKNKCSAKIVKMRQPLMIIQNNNNILSIYKANKSKIIEINMDQDLNILIYNILKYYSREEQLYEEQIRIKQKMKQQQEKQRKRKQQRERKKKQQQQRLVKQQQERRKAEQINKIKAKLNNILKINTKKEDDWKILQSNIKQITDRYKFELNSSLPLITVHYKSPILTIESDYSDKKTYTITITNKDDKFQSIILQQYMILLNTEQEYMKNLKNQIANQELKISITTTPSLPYVQQKIKNQLNGQAIKYQFKLKTSSDSQMKIQYRQAQKKVVFRCKNNIAYNINLFEKIDDALLIIKKNFIKYYIKICEYNKNTQKEINIYDDQLREKAYQAQLRKKIEEKLQEQNKDNQKKIQKQLQKWKEILRKNEQEQERLVRQIIYQARRMEQNRKKKLQQLKQQQQKKQAQRYARMKEQRIRQQLQQKQKQKQQLQRKKQKQQQQRFLQQENKKLQQKSTAVNNIKILYNKSTKPKTLNFRIYFFPDPTKYSDLILNEFKNLGFQTSSSSSKALNLIILTNMHDRGGLSVLDSQLNYQFEQLKQILSTQYCLFINLSPKCYLTSKTFKYSFLKRMNLLGHQLNEDNINKYAQFMHFEINILDKKLKYPSSSNSQQSLNILKRLAKASNN